MPSPRRAVVAVVLVLAALITTSATALAGPLDLDPSFGPAGSGGTITTGGTQGGRWVGLHIYPEGSFLAAGEVGNDKVAVTKRTADGAPDASFAADQPVAGTIAFGGGQGAVIPTDVLVLSDGRILVAATALTATAGTSPGILVARLTADGHLDSSFGTNGIATVTTAAGGVRLGHMALQSTGAIILVGTHPITSNAGVVARLTANGAVDGTFAGSGQIRVILGGAATRLDDVAVDASDRLVLTGWRAVGGASNKGQLVLTRYSAAGVLDSTYGTGGTSGYVTADLDGASPATYDVEGRRIRLAADGRATVAATVTGSGANHLLGLARFTPNGAPDPSFGANGSGTTTQDASPSHITDVADLAVSPSDGALTLAGRMTVGSTQQVAVAGFHADGTPDSTLKPGHTPTTNAANITIGDDGDDEAYAIALTPDTTTALIAGRVTNTPRDTGFLARIGGTSTPPSPAFTTTYDHTRPDRPIRPGQQVTFDAGTSSDADGAITAYAWDLDGDGQTDHTGPTVTTTYNNPGAQTVLLKVTDDDNLTATTGAALTVAANHAPGVAIIEPPTQPQAGKSFTLNAFAGDSDGSVVSYAWDLDGNGSYETGTGTDPHITTKYDTAGQHLIGVRVTDDEGLSATNADNLKVGEGPCVENPTIKIEKAVFITQGTAQAGAGCFHAVTVDKDGIRTITYTTDGHFRLNGLEVDTLLSSKAVLTWKRKLVKVPNKDTFAPGATVQTTLAAANVKVTGTYKSTDFAFIDGKIAWDLAGDTIGGFKVDANAGIGGLPLKTSGEPKLLINGTSTLDILPGTPPELLGKTPSAPMHATFGPSATASDLAPFSYTVDEIPLGVITLGPVVITYKGDGNWAISAKASMAVPVPTTLSGKLELAKGKVKMVDLQFEGAITVGPLLITHVGLTIDFGPKVTANENCVKHVGLEDVTPYAGWDLLDKLLPGYKDYILAHDGPNQVLFHQLFKDYKTPTFALCGSIGLSVAKLVEARFGFGFARYPNPLPNVLFFHGEGRLIEIIKATIDAEITTEGYVHVNAAVKGGYPTNDPWIGWDLGLDFEYFKQQFNAQAWARITIVPLDFTAGAELLASNKGIVGCLTFDTVFGDWHPGGGAKWGHGPKLYLFGCDVDDYKVVIQHALSGDIVIGPPVHGMTAHTASVRELPTTGRGNDATLVRYTGKSAPRARAAQATPDAIDIPAGLPGTVMGFKGDGAPPHVILHGPKGETIDTGIGNTPVQTPGVAALKNPTTSITEVVIAKPSAGRWTVEVAADSARLVEALQANGTRPATITGKVLGSGQDRRLQYAVKGLATGQHVDFAEIGTAAGSIIGRIGKDGTGVLAFHPGEGKAGRRDVQAIVTNIDGYVADRRKLGTYTAPNAPRPMAARKLTLKRKGTSIVLSWPRSAVAKTTQVDIKSSNGLNLSKIVKRPTVRLKAPPAGTTLKITITGTSRTGVLGKPAHFTRKLPKAKTKKKVAHRR
ncbi:MAG TPA: PKD domain-containing protein [Baekduia sp.]|nr:PKD domain-containing protein [Baekduia sp.]